MRVLLVSMLPLLLLTASGCYREKYVIGEGYAFDPKKEEPKYNGWHHHFGAGLLRETPVRVKDHCPSGNAVIQERITLLNGVVGVIGLFGLLYMPTTVWVWCKDSPTTSGSAPAP